MDRLTPEHRSALMSCVKSKNTAPEVTIRKMLHQLGYRFRLHPRNLPGTPDLAFPGKRKAIFVHGCFWHAHGNCKLATMPKSNSVYWKKKFRENRQRDMRKARLLRQKGWSVLTVWQCKLADSARELRRIRTFLDK